MSSPMHPTQSPIISLTGSYRPEKTTMHLVTSTPCTLHPPKTRQIYTEDISPPLPPINSTKNDVCCCRTLYPRSSTTPQSPSTTARSFSNKKIGYSISRASTADSSASDLGHSVASLNSDRGEHNLEGGGSMKVTNSSVSSDFSDDVLEKCLPDTVMQSLLTDLLKPLGVTYKPQTTTTSEDKSVESKEIDERMTVSCSQIKTVVTDCWKKYLNVELNFAQILHHLLKVVKVDLSDLEEPSLGALLHSQGICKPCVFANKNSKVCHNGSSCYFCHHYHKERRRRSKKTKKDIDIPPPPSCSPMNNSMRIPPPPPPCAPPPPPPRHMHSSCSSHHMVPPPIYRTCSSCNTQNSSSVSKPYHLTETVLTCPSYPSSSIAPPSHNTRMHYQQSSLKMPCTGTVHCANTHSRCSQPHINFTTFQSQPMYNTPSFVNRSVNSYVPSPPSTNIHHNIPPPPGLHHRSSTLPTHSSNNQSTESSHISSDIYALAAAILSLPSISSTVPYQPPVSPENAYQSYLPADIADALYPSQLSNAAFNKKSLSLVSEQPLDNQQAYNTPTYSGPDTSLASLLLSPSFMSFLSATSPSSNQHKQTNHIPSSTSSSSANINSFQCTSPAPLLNFNPIFSYEPSGPSTSHPSSVPAML